MIVRGKSAGYNHILKGKLDKNCEWGYINSGLVGLADISVSRLDVMIKKGLTNESPWSIQG